MQHSSQLDRGQAPPPPPQAGEEEELDELDELADDEGDVPASATSAPPTPQPRGPDSALLPAAPAGPAVTFPKRTAPNPREGWSARKLEELRARTREMHRLNAKLDRKLATLQRKWKHARLAKEVLALSLARFESAQRSRRKAMAAAPSSTNKAASTSSTTGTTGSSSRKQGNPFLVYCQVHRPAVREEVRAQSLDLADSGIPSSLVSRTTSLLSQRWQKLAPEERQTYIDMFHVQKERAARASDAHGADDVQGAQDEAEGEEGQGGDTEMPDVDAEVDSNAEEAEAQEGVREVEGEAEEGGGDEDGEHGDGAPS